MMNWLESCIWGRGVMENDGVDGGLGDLQPTEDVRNGLVGGRKKWVPSRIESNSLGVWAANERVRLARSRAERRRRRAPGQKISQLFNQMGEWMCTYRD